MTAVKVHLATANISVAKPCSIQVTIMLSSQHNIKDAPAFLVQSYLHLSPGEQPGAGECSGGPQRACSLPPSPQILSW